MASKGFEKFQKDWTKNPRLIQTITDEVLILYGLTSAELEEISRARKACLGLTGRELETRTSKFFFYFGGLFGRR